MRKIFIAIAFILAFVLSGCNQIMQNPDYEGSTPVTGEPEQQEDSNYNTIVVPSVTNGRVLFYSTPLLEDQLPGEANIAGYYQMGSVELSNLLDTLKKQKWVWDASIDRILLTLDGQIYYNEKWLYFSFEYRTFFYDGYLCEVSDSVMDHIRNYADKMFKYAPVEGIAIPNIGTDNEDVSIVIEKLTYDDELSFTIKWVNNSDKIIEYGHPYTIEYFDGNTWVKLDAKPDTHWTYEALLVYPQNREDKSIESAYETKKFDVSKEFDLSKTGKYRLSSAFNIVGEDQTYTAYIEFEMK